jgi:hypothetical protein
MVAFAGRVAVSIIHAHIANAFTVPQNTGSFQSIFISSTTIFVQGPYHHRLFLQAWLLLKQQKKPFYR